MGEGHIMIELIIGIIIAIFAFPEIAMYLMVFYPAIFNTSNFNEKNPAPFEFLYSTVNFVHETTANYHLVFKIIVFLALPLLYLLISHFVHIGPVYPLQILAFLLMVYCTFTILHHAEILNLDIIWSVTLTIIISLFTLGARLLTFKFLDSMFGGNPYLREKSFKASYE